MLRVPNNFTFPFEREIRFRCNVNENAIKLGTVIIIIFFNAGNYWQSLLIATDVTAELDALTVMQFKIY